VPHPPDSPFRVIIYQLPMKCTRVRTRRNTRNGLQTEATSRAIWRGNPPSELTIETTEKLKGKV
jgi:hypothetical protein